MENTISAVCLMCHVGFELERGSPFPLREKQMKYQSFAAGVCPACRERLKAECSCLQAGNTPSPQICRTMCPIAKKIAQPCSPI